MQNNALKIPYEPLSVSFVRVDSQDILTNSNRKPGIELPLIPF